VRCDAKLGERLPEGAYQASRRLMASAPSRAPNSIACALLFDYLALTQAGGQASAGSAAICAEMLSGDRPGDAPSLEIERFVAWQRQGILVGAGRSHGHRRRRAPAGASWIAPSRDMRRDRRAARRCSVLSRCVGAASLRVAR
jgi:hypothetical protein